MKMIPHHFRCLLSLLLCCSLLFVLPGCDAPATPGDGGGDSSDLSSLPLRDYLEECLSQAEPVIDLTCCHPSREEIEGVFAHLLAEEPDLFFVGTEYTLSYPPGGDGEHPVALTPTYRYQGEALAAAQEDFAGRIQEYIAPIGADWSPLVKVAYLHDRMILDFSYDETVRISDPYTMLLTGRGVCQAYSLLFLALCRATEVSAACVTSFAHTHAWNQVELAGAWYHLDLTWDETVLPYPGRVPHTYFLLTDEELVARRVSEDASWEGVSWDAPHQADGESLVPLGLADSFGATATLDGKTLYYTVAHRVLALSADALEVREVYAIQDPPIQACLMTLLPLGGKVYCNLPYSLLCITPISPASTDASPGETCTLSQTLPEKDLIFCGLSLSPSGLLLLSTLSLSRA